MEVSVSISPEIVAQAEAESERAQRAVTKSSHHASNTVIKPKDPITPKAKGPPSRAPFMMVGKAQSQANSNLLIRSSRLLPKDLSRDRTTRRGDDFNKRRDR